MEQSATFNRAMQATLTGRLRHSTSISTRLSQIPSSGHSTFPLLAENLQNTTNICCWEESVLEDWYLPRIKLWYFSILCIFISKTNKLITSWKNKCFVILLDWLSFSFRTFCLLKSCPWYLDKTPSWRYLRMTLRQNLSWLNLYSASVVSFTEYQTISSELNFTTIASLPSRLGMTIPHPNHQYQFPWR